MRSSHAEIEQMILRLRGVISCRVVATNGSIDEIHVLASLGRAAKQVARDVETTLQAQFAIAIDHRKISIAQLQIADEHPSLPIRPVVASVGAEMTVDETVVRVVLRMGQHTFEGVAQGGRAPHTRGRLAALATLRAIEPVLHAQMRITLEQLLHVPVGSCHVCVVSIAITRAGHEERLVGGALVDADHLEPAVKAVLSALNRRLVHLVDPSLVQ